MNTAAEEYVDENEAFDDDVFSGPGPVAQGQDPQGILPFNPQPSQTPPPVQPGQPTQQVPGQPAPTAQPGMFTMEQVMQIMAARPAPSAPAPEPAPAQMTPEQLAAHLKQFNADDAFASGFVAALQPGEDGKVDPAKVRDTINALVTGVRQEVLRALELNNDTIFGEADQRYGSAASFVQQQKEDRAWNGFAAMYPQLGSCRALVDAKVKTLTFPPGTTRDQAFHFVANSVAQDLANMGIDVNQLPAANQPQRQTRTAPQTRTQPQQFAPAPFVPGYPTLGNPAPSLLTPVTPGMPSRGGRGAPQHRPQQNHNPYFDNDTFAR